MAAFYLTFSLDGKLLLAVDDRRGRLYVGRSSLTNPIHDCLWSPWL